ncbi:tyrosine-protein phosphatase [Arthrobacter sp. I2-34]|uniref:Tyrosine-protein phosphatase n=1 Tax=Arthrobacter hankyongi TaxID=2904801 RepID=A0ABS9L3Q4_9MICC|nr:tyrosine-protein phosphatase [Arthrobacter hankyongi]MCG2621279.1 tyrosine-protein phosphatase [Arthrobacter hankyongi]
MSAHSNTASTDMSLSTLVNLRDLGGIPAAGRRIRAGLLQRSDDFARTTRTQVSQMVSQGLGTIIDLRSAEEAQRTGRGPAGDFDIAYHLLPLSATSANPADMAARESLTPDEVGHWYAEMLLDRSAQIAYGLATIAAAKGAVLVHCAAGKDRTGVFTACLLSALGADQAQIVAEYALTDPAMPSILQRLGRQVSLKDPARPMNALLTAVPENLESMFRVLNDSHGSTILGILYAAGLGDDTVNRLQERLLEPAATVRHDTMGTIQ